MAMTKGVTRRVFLGATAAGGASLLGGSAAAFFDPERWMEASIPELQALFASGRLTSRQLTHAYLERIRDLNPRLGAVIETNPDALAIASRMDSQRRDRRDGPGRGPLHGIPILLKDNIATDDRMETTAGSLALVGSQVPRDARIVGKLRNAGAIILGKTNLSEWANFRGFAPFNGWSARGGFTRNPYQLDFDSSGSSSGSAVAAADNLCAAAVGTETDGSIVSPAGNNLVVGFKPTVGLLSQDGIIPIAHSQDTAGPMCRTVTDAAILLGVMQSPFGDVLGEDVPRDYTKFLRRRALRGARIGVDRRYFGDLGGGPELDALAEEAIDAMRHLGATIIDTDTGDPFNFFDAEFFVLLQEFKVDVGRYLRGLRHTSLRTLADLIAFNAAHCPQEMKYFGQELFEEAETTNGDLEDPDYLAARALCLQLTRAEGIDAALHRDRLDAIVAPNWSWASSPAAVAGYPNISIPTGITPEGWPGGLWMYSGFLREPRLLAYAYDLEQEVQARRRPRYRGQVPPEPPDAGLCSAPAGAQAFRAAASPGATHKMTYHIGTGRPIKR